jgi:putative ABC transport system permease protein
MKYLPLVWAGLARSRLRTLLTFLTVVIAFLLFGVLHGVSGGFDAVVNSMSNTRLRIQNRESFTRWMPIAMRDQIARVPGVTGVAAYAYFGGYYQDPKNGIGAGALDMKELFKVYPEIELPAAARTAILRDRTGVLVGADLARKYGWKVGDRLTIGTPIWTHPDGSRNWSFTIDGIYRFHSHALTADNVWMRLDYFDDARTELPHMVSQYIVAIRDPASAARIGREIDALYRNSATPTLTQSEKDYIRSQIRDIGNIEFLVDAIIGAVLFTLLALTANTMMQSVRERTAELAVLKTFGYSNRIIACLVTLESLLLCLVAAVCGLGIAALVFPTIIQRVGIGAIPIPASVVGAGLSIAVCLALVSAALPLWRASRLDVAAALAAH